MLLRVLQASPSSLQLLHRSHQRWDSHRDNDLKKKGNLLTLYSNLSSSSCVVPVCIPLPPYFPSAQSPFFKDSETEKELDWQLGGTTLYTLNREHAGGYSLMCRPADTASESFPISGMLGACTIRSGIHIGTPHLEELQLVYKVSNFSLAILGLFAPFLDPIHLA